MAESSYYVAFLLTINSELTMRVAAAAQQEGGESMPDPESWAREHRWQWGTQADWVAAVAAAIDTGITLWGNNPAVITDQHILSWVQSAIPPTP